MSDAFSRTELLFGPAAMEKLAAATVAVFGVGGVGSYAAEALARSGVGSFVLVDDDRVCASNINRQIIALRSTVGAPKVLAMKERILDINPAARVEAFQEFYGADSADRLLPPGLSYVVDAIDTVSSKIDLIVRCIGMGIPVISSMGAGNKLDPTRLEIADIYETSVCPLARVMRRELKSRGVQALTVVYSREPPIPANAAAEQPARIAGRRSIPGSVAFVPQPPASSSPQGLRDIVGAS
jgi:tRNA A37 threonylcarbamoyladenosine dehydratase